MIQLVRSGGLAGRTEEWTIYGDGRVTSSKGTETSLAPDQVSSLVAGIQAAGFFGLQPRYGGKASQCRDCYEYQLTVTGGGQTKTVAWTEDPGKVPAELNKIMELLGPVTVNK